MRNSKNADALLRDCVRDYFVELIETGQLRAGALLPPTRALGNQFGVSRDTVVRAYEELKRLSYIKSSSTKGFSVNNPIPTSRAQEARTSRAELPAERLSVFGRFVSENFPLPSDFPGFNFDGPPIEFLPVRLWRKRIQYFEENLCSIDSSPQLLGRHELRQAIAAFLGRCKQIQCSADSVSVFANTYGATSLLCRLLLNPGDTIAAINPGCDGIKNIAKTQQLKLLPIFMDLDGICVETIVSSEQNVRLVYLSHCPSGAGLSGERREQLLQWAKITGAWIIEDDFDGYFSFGKSSTNALRALDDGTSVIYLATFCKLLYPLTSLGFCLLPESLIKLVERSMLELEGISETIPQLALAAMIEDGDLERYMRKLQKEYAARRRMLIFNLKKSLEHSVQIIRDDSGTQCLVNFPECTNDMVLRAAKDSGFPLTPTANLNFSPSQNSSFLIDFSCLPEEQLGHQTQVFAGHLQHGAQPRVTASSF